MMMRLAHQANINHLLTPWSGSRPRGILVEAKLYVAIQFVQPIPKPVDSRAHRLHSTDARSNQHDGLQPDVHCVEIVWSNSSWVTPSLKLPMYSKLRHLIT